MTGVGDAPFTSSGPRLPGNAAQHAGSKVVPIGRHGRPREEIKAIQRRRIVDAFVDEVGQNGYEGVRVVSVCIEAGVSTKEFYAIFRGKESCFLYALDVGTDVVCDLMQSTFDHAPGSWEHRLQLAVTAMLVLLAANPGFARLSVVEAAKATALSADHVAATTMRCSEIFSGPRPRPALANLPSDAFMSTLVGRALRPMVDYVESGRVSELPALAATITYSIASPVVGEERALRAIQQSG